jgi:hypothetical protein
VTRRRRDVELAPAGAVDAERRYHWLGRYGIATEPDTVGGRMHLAIRAERGRLDGKGVTAASRLAALRAFLRKHGWLDGAEQFVDQLDRARARRTKGK